MKNDENYKHKFKCIVSNSKYIAGSSFICLKCEECFCGCDEKKDMLISLLIKDFDEICLNINKKSCCLISDNELLIKEIIE